MEPIDARLLNINARLAAVELLLAQLCQRFPDLQREIEKSLAQAGDLLDLSGVGIPQQPEVADLLSGELQEAWRALLQRAVIRG